LTSLATRRVFSHLCCLIWILIPSISRSLSPSFLHESTPNQQAAFKSNSDSRLPPTPTPNTHMAFQDVYNELLRWTRPSLISVPPVSSFSPFSTSFLNEPLPCSYRQKVSVPFDRALAFLLQLSAKTTEASPLIQTTKTKTKQSTQLYSTYVYLPSVTTDTLNHVRRKQPQRSVTPISPPKNDLRPPPLTPHPRRLGSFRTGSYAGFLG